MFDSLFPSHWTTLRKLMWLKLKGASAVWSTITGNPVSFTAKAAPLRKLEVAFSPVQSGSGDPSPDNVRPILGWDSLNVEMRGKNLLNPVAKTNGFYAPSVGSSLPDLTRDYSSFADNALTVNGTAWNGNGFVSDRVFAGKTYKVTGALTATTPRCSVVTLDEEYKVVRNIRNIAESGEWNESITIADGEMYIGLSLVNAADSPITLANPSVSESGEYQPYTGRSISITLGSTVYSGYVDVVTGVVTVDHYLAVVDETLPFSNWAAPTTPWVGIAVGTGNERLPEMKLGRQNGLPSNMLKSVDHNTSSWNVYGVNGNLYICLNENALGGRTYEYIKSWLANNNIQIFYPLANPIPIQLTPQEVQSLAGDNTMWSNANQPITVEYRSN